MKKSFRNILKSKASKKPCGKPEVILSTCYKYKNPFINLKDNRDN